MIFVDDRTDEQKQTHMCIIGGTDRFLSHWGQAGNGPSYAFWACKPEHRLAVSLWVRSRTDMKRVRWVRRDYRPPTHEGHCHIYVVNDGHPALKGG